MLFLRKSTGSGRRFGTKGHPEEIAAVRVILPVRRQITAYAADSSTLCGMLSRTPSSLRCWNEDCRTTTPHGVRDANRSSGGRTAAHQNAAWRPV